MSNLLREEYLKLFQKLNNTNVRNKRTNTIIEKSSSKEYNENTKKEVVLMTLEEFKKKVEENLTKVAGKKEAQETMKLYENDFPTILKENWTVEGITPALLMRFY